MTSTPALARTAPAPAPAPRRPELRLVQTGRGRVLRVPFLVVCATLLTAGLIAVLVLNIMISQGSYALDDLRTQAATLDDQAVALRHDLDQASSTGNLAAAAGRLGMAPADAPVFVDPDARTVTGVRGAGGQASGYTVVTGRQAATMGQAPAGGDAGAATGAAGLGLGGGLVGAVSSLAP